MAASLRHESEGGGKLWASGEQECFEYGWELVSFELKEKGIAVGIVHPGFMRTETTRWLDLIKFWDVGGGIGSLNISMYMTTDRRCIAVTPDESAESLIKFIDEIDIKSTGEYWAPRGPR